MELGIIRVTNEVCDYVSCAVLEEGVGESYRERLGALFCGT